MKTSLKLTLVLVVLSILGATLVWGREPDRSQGWGKGYGRRIGLAQQCQQINPCDRVCDNCINNERDKNVGSTLNSTLSLLNSINLSLRFTLPPFLLYKNVLPVLVFDLV